MEIQERFAGRYIACRTMGSELEVGYDTVCRCTDVSMEFRGEWT